MKGLVLLLDDNPLDLKIATTVLEREGFACQGFTNVEEAKKWAADNTPQVIFLDIQMPDASGFELIPIFRQMERTKKSNIVMMSGRNQMEDVKKAVQIGANDYLVKPIDTLVLQEKVRKMSQQLEKEDFASVAVPENFLDSVVEIKKMEVVALSEFGMQVRSFHPVVPGQTIEIGGLPPEHFGATALLARCLNTAPDPEARIHYLQFTFVGLTEGQRQSIRKLCRQIWVQNKGSVAA